MTTTKSYSNKGRFLHLYRTGLKQNLAFGIVAMILFLLAISLVYFVAVVEMMQYYQVQDLELEQGILRAFRCGIYLDAAQSGLVMAMVMVMTMISCLMINSYMHNKKKVDLYHSLPVKRDHLFLSNMLVTLTLVLAPYLLCVLVTMIAQMVQFGGYLLTYGAYYKYMLLDVVSITLAAVVVYLLTALVAVNVGTEFDTFAITAIIGFLPMIVYAVCVSVWSALTYGASTDLYEEVLWLSPFTFPFYRYEIVQHFAYEGTTTQNVVKYLILMLTWLVIGGGMYWFSRIRYRLRKSEIAEQAQSKGPFQTIAKCFAAFCGGALFFAIFYANGNYLKWAVAILIGSLLIGAIAELIFSRGFRSLRKNLKWLLGTGVLVCLLVIGSSMDFIGFTRKVPAAADVASVSVDYQGRFGRLSESMSYYHYDQNGRYPFRVLTDPKSIQTVIKAHQSAADNQPPTGSLFGGNYDPQWDETHPYFWMDLEYAYSSGKTLSRRFNRVSREAVLTLSELETQPDFIRSRHPLFYLGDEKLTGKKLDVAELISGVTCYNAYGQQIDHKSLSPSEKAKLVEAVRSDMLGESLESIRNPESAAVACLEFRFYSGINMEYSSNNVESIPYNCYVIVTDEYAETLDFLNSLGTLSKLQELPEADKIKVTPIHNYSNYNQVVPLLPDEQRSEYRDGYSDPELSDEDSVLVTDKAQIASMMEKGRNQMLVQEGGFGVCDAALMMYFRDGMLIGSQMIRTDDIPPSVFDQLANTYDIFRSEDELEATPLSAASSEVSDVEVSVSSEADL